MIVIALGSNIAGPWGTPRQTLERTLGELDDRGIHAEILSPVYHTIPHGFSSQHMFLNAIAVVTTPLPAHALLQELKEIEAEAGRTASRSWMSRTVDLDIIDYRGLIFNWKVRVPRSDRRVVLPHPRAHTRAFVLRPLSEILPFWHHPVFGLTASQFLKKPGVSKAGAILSRDEEPLRWHR